MSDARRNLVRWVKRRLTLPPVTTRRLSIFLFTVLSAYAFFHVAAHHHAPAVLLLWPVFSLASARWPATSMIGASLLLRFFYAEVCCTDQIAVSQAAWERVIGGLGGPYGVGYEATDPPGAPFPYGPLALIWWLPGPPVELIAALGVMAILAARRALVTLAVFAAWQPWLWLTMAGVNDFSPGFLLLAGLLLIRYQPVAGAMVIAVAAALKPYVFAWFLPAIGFGGLIVAASLALVTATLWAPLFLWWGGVPAFLETVRLAANAHPVPNAINVPVLRWAAVPFLILSLKARRWDDMVILGSAAFIVFLFFDKWASDGYWVAVVPSLGLALEERFRYDERGALPARRKSDQRRRRREVYA